MSTIQQQNKMTLYNYCIKLETCPDLYDQNGMRYGHEELDNGINMSPIIKINHKFVKGTSFSVECKGRKRSKGYHEILFTKEILDSWCQGYDGYDYLMIELDDYTFHRWGEMPFLVLKGKVGLETTGEKYVHIKECFTCDLTFYDFYNNQNSQENQNTNWSYCDKSQLVYYHNQSDGNTYYDYTYIFDTMPKSKL
jgi:hypothetical protein